MEWAVYTLLDWSTNENLFVITITNNQSTQVKGVMLEMEILVANSPAIANCEIATGVTWGNDIILPGQSIVYHNNSAFLVDAIRNSYQYSTAFEDAVMASGSTLPAGDYTYNFRLLYDELWATGQVPGIYPNPQRAIDNGGILGTYSQTISISQPSDPELQYPGIADEEGLSIYESNPTFQWMSSGATSGRLMFYTILICEKEETQSNDEAILNLPFFELNWADAIQVTELGYPIPVSFPYPTSEEGFSAGNKYVWQVFVRCERNMEDPSAGFTAESQIFCFQYGDTPNPVNPPHEGSVTSVTPSFVWTSALGAQGYQVRVAGDDDPEVESNYWEEDAPATSLNHVPENQYLTPGKTYYWKVRALPEGRWCLPAMFTVQTMEMTSPALDEEVNTVLPLFSVTAPQGIAAFEFQISGSDDPELNNPYSFFSTSTNYTYTTNEAFPLQPGAAYYWRVLPLNSNQDLIGELDDYLEISRFSVQAMELTSPAQNDEINTVLPLFSVTAPQGIAAFEFQISGSEDPELNNPYSFFSNSTNYIYTVNEDFPLQPGATFFWRVLPLNQSQELIGELDDYLDINRFSIQAISITIPDINSTINNLSPIFSWTAPTGVQSWELVIRDEVNQGVQSGITATSYIYPPSAELPLVPGKAYYWRIIPMMGSNIVGEIEDYAENNFNVQPIELQLPVNNSTVSTLHPNFMWEGPVLPPGTQFEFQISSDEDPEVLNPDFTLRTSDYSFIYLSNEEFALEPVNTYYWKVRIFSAEQGLIGEPDDFMVSNFTIQFSDELSLNISIPSNTPLLPQFSWSSVPLANSYMLAICNTPDDYDIYFEKANLTGTNYNYLSTDEQLEFNVEYYAKVKAFQDNTMIVESEFVPFTCEISAPGLNVTINETDPLHPVFDWSAVPGAAGYHIYINNAPDLSQYFWDLVTSLTSISYPVDAQSLNFGSTYFALVQAVNAEGEPYGPPSAIVSFSISAVNYELTADVPENDPLHPVFSWSAIPGAAGYHIYVNSTADLTQFFWDAATSLTNITYPVDAEPLNFAYTYFVLVQAVDGAGDPYGPPSTVVSFSIAAIDYGLTVTLPQNNPLYPVFNWNSIPSAASYSIVISMESNLSPALFEGTVQAITYTYSESDPPLMMESTYYVQVQALDAQGNPLGAPSNIETFQTPELEYVINWQILENTPLNPIFNWMAINGASAYLFTLYEGVDLSTPIFDLTITALNLTYPANVPPLTFGAAYTVTLQALNAAGDPIGPPSPPITFVLPGLPVIDLISPGLGDAIASTTPEFQWTTLPFVNQYEVKLSPTDNIANSIWEAQTQGGSAQYPSNNPLEYGHVYYWQVTGYLSTGMMVAQSSIQYFSIRTFVPEPLLPLNGGTTMSLNPTFSWTDASFGGVSPAYYRLLIGTNPTLPAPFYTGYITTTSIIYPQSALPLSYSSLYYWRVRAFNEDEEPMGPPCIVQSFYTPLGGPNLISPVNTSAPIVPLFEWETVAGADRYEFGVFTDEGLANQLWWSGDIGQVTSWQYQGPELAYETIYYWYVQAFDATGQPYGLPSAKAFFVTPSLGAPNLITPVGGAVIADLMPLFDFSDTPTAVNYNIQISPTSDFDSPLASLNTPTSSMQYPGTPAFDWDTEYFWRVGAYNANGNLIGDDFSEVENFRTPVFSAPNLVAPSGEITTNHPDFLWEELPGVAGYRIQIAANAAFSEILWDDQVAPGGAPYGAAEALAYNQDYFWRLRGLDGNGSFVGQWADPLSFHCTLTSTIALIAPVGIEIFSLNPTFEWNAVEGAAKYGIWVYADEGQSSQLWYTNQLTSLSVTYPSQGVPALSYGNTYYWKAAAFTAANVMIGNPSEVVSFTTSASMLPVPSYPVGVQVEDLVPTFSWEPIEGISNFWIQVAMNESFSPAIWSNSMVTGNSVTYGGTTPLLYGQTYWWRVRVMNAQGQPVGDFCAPAQFTTPSGEIQIELLFGP